MTSVGPPPPVSVLTSPDALRSPSAVSPASADLGLGPGLARPSPGVDSDADAAAAAPLLARSAPPPHPDSPLSPSALPLRLTGALTASVVVQPHAGFVTLPISSSPATRFAAAAADAPPRRPTSSIPASSTRSSSAATMRSHAAGLTCTTFHRRLTDTKPRDVLQQIGAFLYVMAPVIFWLLLFTQCKYIPSAWRPEIRVRLLPLLDDVLFRNPVGVLGTAIVLASLGVLVLATPWGMGMAFIPLVLHALNSVAHHPMAVLDVLGWMPYGVLHYISPAVFGIWLWRARSARIARHFVWAFGFMNAAGVLTQIFFPNAPPWYYDTHGFEAANYTMPGNPGGLARVDALFGTAMYANAFGNSPLVFGAFPSLHSGFAVIIMLFALHFNRILGRVLCVYVCWQWWATMYLHHHYMVDLLFGGIYAFTAYQCTIPALRRAEADLSVMRTAYSSNASAAKREMSAVPISYLPLSAPQDSSDDLFFDSSVATPFGSDDLATALPYSAAHGHAAGKPEHAPYDPIQIVTEHAYTDADRSSIGSGVASARAAPIKTGMRPRSIAEADVTSPVTTLYAHEAALPDLGPAAGAKGLP